MLTDREREFRLRPRKPPGAKCRNEIGAWSVLYKAVMRHARMTRKVQRRGSRSGGFARPIRRFNQRCAVRIIYSRNTVRGQWGAHGRYVARESAARSDGDHAPGFDGEAEFIRVAERLDAWQRAGDERMWKVIISPEFGEQIDLRRLTRELMDRIERDLGGTRLEWVAVTHHNTEHPHIHVALRGVDRNGRTLHLPREFIKQGMREMAEDLCTKQLGYRTEVDAANAERRELNQYRYTSLDRAITWLARGPEDDASSSFRITLTAPDAAGRHEGARLRDQRVLQRLMSLQRMGLAEPAQGQEWRVQKDFESVLRSMQRIGDRQKTLAAHGAPMSDPRLPIEMVDGRDWTVLEGRVLVHGEEETGPGTGRSYLMLEGTDARVHHVFYTPEIEEARNRGQLRTNSFVRFRRYMVGGMALVETEDLGDAEAILRNKRHLHETVRHLMKRGVILEEVGWGGWLGRYQAAVRLAALEAERPIASEPERSARSGAARGR